MIPGRASRAAAVADAVARRAAGDLASGRRRCLSAVVLHFPDRHRPQSPLCWGRPPLTPTQRLPPQMRGMCDCGWKEEVLMDTPSSSSSYAIAVEQRHGTEVFRQLQQPRRQHHRKFYDFGRRLRVHDSTFSSGNVTRIGSVPMAAVRRSPWYSHRHVTDPREAEGRRCLSSRSVVSADVSDGPMTRSCLSSSDRDGGPDDDDGGPRRSHGLESARDTGFHVAFLGTGGSIPSRHRNTSCTALRLGGHTLLFDVGEGLQRQLALSTLSVLEIRQIYVTHLHGDHLFGLPGLLLQIGITRKVRSDARRATAAAGNGDVDFDVHDGVDEDDDEEETIELYGPPGLYNYVAMTMTLSCARFHRLRLVVHELTGGGEEAGPRPPEPRTRNRGGSGGRSERGLDNDETVGGGNDPKNPFLDGYPEFASSVPNVTKVRVPRDDDGTWTLRTPSRPTREEIRDLYESKDQKRLARLRRKSQKQRRPDGVAPQRPTKRLPGSFHRRQQVHVRAAELIHQPGVQTFGFVVTEVEPPPPIDPKKAERLGVRPGPKYMLLKHGYPVDRDDGDDGDDEGDNDRGSTSRKVVHPKQVLLPPKHLPRKFALLGDHCVVPEPMARLCEGADVLVHEAAGTKREASEALRRGHATASMAGRMADEVNAKVLVLNHFRGGMQGRESIEETVREAEDAIVGDGGRSISSRLVIAAYDFMELLVPRGGV